MAWKIAPSQFPLFLHHFYLFPHTHLLPLSPSLSPCVSLSPTLLGFSVAAHHRGASLSPLMAQLLALMHFKHTAAATPQSDRKCTSSSSLCSFFHAILSHRVALHVKPSSMTQAPSWVKHAADANLASTSGMKLASSGKIKHISKVLCGFNMLVSVLKPL